ncbi:cell division ATP-binding protein FtsE [Hirschia baltica]|uniref:Cell division ATP-binding protein FtsE n=1 Tax=Hirschia baltica (strain ATCC 49814 / DSM 5838 / IFAM 1418) TaxID=582402 RepID=C6XLM9_HIRBI|nr:ATP-binding cassette domain-containing protein [Hirschia baltica]ACT57935.1 cell division ATP-binding protein FtsE [Hirschia baltica ATCC 49814]
MKNMSLEEPAVQFDQVSLSYGLDQDVLTQVSMELHARSFTLLTGPSGAGKTTLLKLAYLALLPTSGNISLFGVNTGRLNRTGLAKLRRRVGVVFQEFRLLDHLTAYENAALPLRVVGEPEKHYRDDVIELLRWVGLGDRLDARPETLSGGEKQRVAIARAIVGKPDLLIADEPTGNVDPEMGDRLLRLFQELNKRLGTTVLIATHDQDMVKNAGAEVLRLADGSVMHQVSNRPSFTIS